MRHFGMAKIYSLANRVPVSAVLSISSELVLALDSSTRIVFINDAFARFLTAPINGPDRKKYRVLAAGDGIRRPLP